MHRLEFRWQQTGAWAAASRAALACAAAGLLAAGPVRAADGPALVTIVEGSAVLIDGTRSTVAAPGLRVGAATIVETAPTAQMLRVEFSDGSVLDLGPDTRAMLLPPGLAGSGPRAPAFYLLQGWAKHGSAGVAKPGGQLAFGAEVLQPSGTTVSRVKDGALELFVESGSVQLLERRVKPPSTLALKAGEFYARDGEGKGQVTPRPVAGFLPSVPRAFRDTIPPRAAALKGQRVEPQAAAALTYAALQDWLAAESVIRREFPRRFASLARQSAFREGLVKNLSSHPEWEPILFPKPPASAPTPYLRPDSPRS